MSAYITPKLLGGGRVFLLATEIFDQAATTVNWPTAAALALYTLLLVALLLACLCGIDAEGRGMSSDRDTSLVLRGSPSSSMCCCLRRSRSWL